MNISQVSNVSVLVRRLLVQASEHGISMITMVAADEGCPGVSTR